MSITAKVFIGIGVVAAIAVAAYTAGINQGHSDGPDAWLK